MPNGPHEKLIIDGQNMARYNFRGDDMLETGAGLAAGKAVIGGILGAKLVKLAGVMPFMVLMAGGGPRMNLVRIVEALIIAAVTAGIVMYANQQTMGVRIESLSSDVGELRKSVDQIRNDFYMPRFREVK